MKNIVLAGLLPLLLAGCVAKSKYDDVAKQLAATRAELATLKATVAQKQAVPVRVTFKKEGRGDGYSAKFDTTIKKDFPVLVTVSSHALGTRKEHRLDLSWEHTAEVGHSQGTPINDGDTLEIRNNDYETLVVKFKQPEGD